MSAFVIKTTPVPLHTAGTHLSIRVAWAWSNVRWTTFGRWTFAGYKFSIAYATTAWLQLWFGSYFNHKSRLYSNGTWLCLCITVRKFSETAQTISYISYRARNFDIFMGYSDKMSRNSNDNLVYLLEIMCFQLYQEINSSLDNIEASFIPQISYKVWQSALQRRSTPSYRNILCTKYHYHILWKIWEIKFLKQLILMYMQDVLMIWRFV